MREFGATQDLTQGVAERQAAGRPTSRNRLANDTGSTGAVVADKYPQMPQKNNPQELKEERRDDHRDEKEDRREDHRDEKQDRREDRRN
jgi:hypothetical protein